ncbi:hypothetical protein GCM10023321_72660 [Pseudonocardia eucalypti]|uniref:PrgI family protein n=1 Tax=Pseudonocardia eucalypti TaxID=648755 RepID=A0ABP9R7X9_9PSEU|nr:hypothetical protein [Pseudonocardia eucalypti]
MDQRSEPVPIPANIDLEDKIVADLNGRQVIILLGAVILLYLAYTATRDLLPLWAFAVVAVPVIVVALALALVRRDGVTLDRYLLAAVIHLTTTRALAEAKPDTRAGAVEVGQADPGRVGRGGWWTRLRRPSRPVTLAAREVAQAGGFGVVDLGTHGMGAAAVVSTVSWSLRSEHEQAALVATFARYLNSLATPMHLLVRATPLDLSGHIARLDTFATTTGHVQPALAAAAADHADHLAQLAAEHTLLRRQIVLVFREPNPPTPATSAASQARRDRAALNRLGRQLADAAALLAPAGLAVTALDAHQAEAVLYAACRPHQPTTAHPGGTNPAELYGAGRYSAELDGVGAVVAAGRPPGADHGGHPLLPGERQ